MSDASGTGGEPEVSVVIPTHTRWPLLSRTLGAVLRQEDVDLEVIVVDDGSRDETPERLAAIDDPRLRVLRHDTAQGVARARNAGIALARAPWVALTDDDDLWSPRKLRVQLDELTRVGATWGYGAGVIIDDAGRVLDVFDPPRPADIARRLVAANAVPGGCSDVMARTDAVRRIGGFDPQFSVLADYDFFLRLSRAGKAGMYRGHEMAYTQHPASMSLVDIDRVAGEFGRLRAKHAAEGVELEPASLWRWIAFGRYQRGKRLSSARLYFATAARHWDLLSVPRGLVVLTGRRLTEQALRRRRRVPGADLAWLHVLTGARSGTSSPHVGLSGLFLSQESAGVGTYAWELAAALGAQRPDWRFTLFCGVELTPPLALPPNVRLSAAPVPLLRWTTRAVWEQAALSRQATRAGVDLLHSLNGSGPFRAPVPHVVTIHDVIFERAPEDYSTLRRTLLGGVFRRTARSADRVLTVSEEPAADIVSAYRVDPAHVRVVHNGPGTRPSPAGPEARAAFRRRHDLAPDVPLILTVGSAHHYKNLDGAVRALAELKRRGVRAEWCVVGSLGHLGHELRALATGLGAPMRWHGWASSADLEAAYAEATVVALPSQAEGFGLPLLEAFARGRAAVASRIRPFEEIAGDAAVIVDTRDPAAFAGAVADLIGDPERRAWLAAAGERRLAAFSWERCARETGAVYDELLGSVAPEPATVS